MVVGAITLFGKKTFAKGTVFTFFQGVAMKRFSSQTPGYSLYIPQGTSGWCLIMQSGVLLPCKVYTPVSMILQKDFELSADVLRKIDVFILDGQPVDDIDKTIVPDGARLALAAGLPGIAGLAMKQNTVLRGLRPGITHKNTDSSNAPEAGGIELALYSLALPLLAKHFLKRGVVVSALQILRYLRLGGMTGDCVWNGQEMLLKQVEGYLNGFDSKTEVLLSVDFIENS